MIVNFNLDETAKAFEPEIIKIYETALKETKRPQNVAINLVFVDENKIQEMNKKYRGVDRVTDVLSFPMIEDFDYFDKEYDFLIDEVDIGDIYINPQRAKEQAEEYGHSYKREVCFLALHGLLHLLGYDHMTELEEKEMFSLQNVILEKAGISRDI